MLMACYYQNLGAQSVSAVVLAIDGKCFYLLEPDGLFQFRFPLLQHKIANRGSSKAASAFAWSRVLILVVHQLELALALALNIIELVLA
jgi:hypothetical protein